MNTKSLTAALAGLLLVAPVLAACSHDSGGRAGHGAGAAAAGAAAAPKESRISPVLLLGDSVAAGLAAPMTEAFAASGNRFQSLASDGGGNVVGPFADENWVTLPQQIAASAAHLVVYQVTTYDWGTEDEQRAGYERLATTVAAAGAELVLVTMPPIRADDFYQPHVDELARTAAVARAVADGSGGKAAFFDATDVWGADFQPQRDGVTDRSSDGIHVCPQGAARFTVWLTGKLAERYPDFTPADATTWANTGWSSDEHFVGC